MNWIKSAIFAGAAACAVSIVGAGTVLASCLPYSDTGFSSMAIAEIASETLAPSNGVAVEKRQMAFRDRYMFKQGGGANPVFHLFMGYGLIETGKPAQALGHFEQALYFSRQSSICGSEQIEFLAQIARVKVLSPVLEDSLQSGSAYMAFVQGMFDQDLQLFQSDYPAAICILRLGKFPIEKTENNEENRACIRNFRAPQVRPEIYQLEGPERN